MKQKGIKSSTKNTMIFICVFALLWNLISSTFVFVAIPQELEKGNYAIYTALLFPLVGIFFLILAVRAVLIWLKFGDSIFYISSAIVGGELKGEIYVNGNIVPEGGFSVRLSCINKVTSGVGDSRGTKEIVLWQCKYIMEGELRRSRKDITVIPALFHIPYECKETDEANHNNSIIWRLEIEADIPGIDYVANFNIPVLRTKESSADFIPDRSTVSGFEIKEDIDNTLRKAKIKELPAINGGTKYVFPMMRNKGASFGITVLLCIWTAIVYFLFKTEVFSDLFAYIFGFFNVLIFMSWLDTLFYRSFVTISDGTLKTSGGLFCFGKTITFREEDIKEIKEKLGMQSGNNLYYRIELIAVDGKKYTLAKQLNGLHLAEELIKKFKKL